MNERETALEAARLLASVERSDGLNSGYGEVLTGKALALYHEARQYLFPNIPKHTLSIEQIGEMFKHAIQEANRQASLYAPAEPDSPSFRAGERTMRLHLEAGLATFCANHHSPTRVEISEYVKQSAIEASDYLSLGWYPAINAAPATSGISINLSLNAVYGRPFTSTPRRINRASR